MVQFTEPLLCLVKHATAAPAPPRQRRRGAQHPRACTTGTRAARPQVTSSEDEDTDELVLTFTNTGVPMSAATLEAFADPSDPRHASQDPFSRMRAGLRFVAQILRVSGGSVTAARSGGGGGAGARGGGCTVVVRLPRSQRAAAYAPTIVLPDGTTSLQDVPQRDILAAVAALPQQPGLATPRRYTATAHSVSPNPGPPRQAPRTCMLLRKLCISVSIVQLARMQQTERCTPGAGATLRQGGRVCACSAATRA